MSETTRVKQEAAGMPRAPRTRPPLRDFAVALVIVLLCNQVTLGEFDDKVHKTPRRQSYRFALWRAAEWPERGIADVVILGDSRSQVLEARDLCDALPGEPAHCINSSSAAGDWVTALGLFQAQVEHVDRDTLVLLMISDYWLEMGSAGELETLPWAPAYATLGHPIQALASYVPLSFARGGRMKALRARLDDAGRRVAIAVGGPRYAVQEPPRAESLMKLHRSNVDSWFVPIDERTRDERIANGHRMLEYLTARSDRVILVNLPNSKPRSVYVDRNFPGRRERFLRDAAGLARAHDVPFVDMTGELEWRDAWQDFHHVKEGRARRLARLVAERVSPHAQRD